MLLDALPSVDADPADRPLLASAMMQNVHTIETVDADNLLLDGQFHNKRAERDHMATANPRSLIFDTPAIFSHRHVVRSGKVVQQQAKEKPMVETIAAENGEAGKDH